MNEDIPGVIPIEYQGMTFKMEKSPLGFRTLRPQQDLETHGKFFEFDPEKTHLIYNPNSSFWFNLPGVNARASYLHYSSNTQVTGYARSELLASDPLHGDIDIQCRLLTETERWIYGNKPEESEFMSRFEFNLNYLHASTENSKPIMGVNCFMPRYEDVDSIALELALPLTEFPDNKHLLVISMDPKGKVENLGMNLINENSEYSFEPWDPFAMYLLRSDETLRKKMLGVIGNKILEGTVLKGIDVQKTVKNIFSIVENPQFEINTDNLYKQIRQPNQIDRLINFISNIIQIQSPKTLAKSHFVKHRRPARM